MKPYMDRIFKEKGKRDTKHLYFNIKNKTKNLYKEIHASHRSNLLRKNFEFYSKFGWKEPDNLPYIWGDLK